MRGGHMGGFFSFKKMLTVPFVKTLYFVVFMGINLCAFVLLLNQFIFHVIMIPEIAFLERQPFLWPILFLATHLFWRFFCEGVIVVFRIYEMLVSIESKMEEAGALELTEAIKPEKLPRKLKSRRDFRKWKESRLHLFSNKQAAKPDGVKSDNVS
jgi:hypothetical protein